MNFDDAVKAHTFWKVTLRWLVNGRRGLDEEMAHDDRACELGAWIHGEGSRYAQFPAFAEMVSEHAEFHRLAGEVARLTLTGDTAAADRMLAPDGEFSRASDRTISAIFRLQAQVEKAH